MKPKMILVSYIQVSSGELDVKNKNVVAYNYPSFTWPSTYLSLKRGVTLEWE